MSLLATSTTWTSIYWYKKLLCLYFAMYKNIVKSKQTIKQISKDERVNKQTSSYQ